MRALRSPALVLLVALVLTVASVAAVEHALANERRARFDKDVVETLDRIEARMETYVAVLRGARGFVGASAPVVSRASFLLYVDALQLPQRYPGVQGIGWSPLVPGEERDAWLAAVRADYPTFRLWPPQEGAAFAIHHLEPLDARNAAALGYDMATEPARRAAMDRARDTGDAAMTDRLVLVQEIDEHKQPGFLIYVPVYASGRPSSTIDTPDERRRALRGFAYAPFRAGDLFAGIFGEGAVAPVWFKVYDGDDVGDHALLFDSSRGRWRDGSPRDGQDAALRTIDVAGQRWTIALTPSPSSAQRLQRAVPGLLGAAGLAFSGALFGLTRGQARARRAAERNARVSETLSSVGLALSAEHDVERIVQRVTDESTRLTAAAFGAYFHNVPNEEGRYGLYTLSGAPREAFAKFPPVRATPLFKLTFDGESVLSEDVTRHESFARNPPYHGMPKGHLPVRSYLAVPVRGRGGRIHGGLFFGHPETGRFRPEHVSLVEGLAAQAAVALDNAGLVDALREAIRAREDFLSVASHELKTPLTTIELTLSGMLRAAAAGRSDAAPIDRLRRLDVQVHRLLQLVDQLLDVVRLSEGRVVLERAPTDLAALAASVASRFEDAAARAGSPIEVRSRDPVVVPLDAGRFDQVLTNLVGNALKYGAGKPVAIVVEQRDDHARVRVVDRGPGIAPEDQARVFERFERAASSRNYGGLGLGLWISRQIVEAHGGRIGIESALTQGACFYVELPLAPAAAASPGRA